ncbi:hypothetical protein L207DRAFT_605271 [Hyaloscypha variabilis F]|uniref:Uncharacterized protein n=1 Tax=Hyaloscypha variabilis (strain UAMH 11265 / GT02V1 / F) TaxID=1149755 RepID=A0A2J6R4W9_HYAVF|nr:hypothetical protein L207DRAFT_605271 [Hyaloscypha variabilis F]
MSFTLPDDIHYHTPSLESEGESSGEKTYSTSSKMPSSSLVGHACSDCSFQCTTEPGEHYRINFPDEPHFSLIEDINRWLSNEQQPPWSHLELARGRSSPEDTAGNHPNRFEEFRRAEYPFEDYNTWPDVPILSPRDFLDSRFIMIDEQENTASEESTLTDPFTLAAQLRQYLRQNQEYSSQALKVRFHLVEALILVGNYGEAEDHCDALKAILTPEHVATLTGMLLVRTGCEEDAINWMFVALTNFILNCTNYSIQQNKRIFGRIYNLFGETGRLSEKNWDSLTKRLKGLTDLVATFEMSTPDQDVRRICPELFIHGFQIAHECTVLKLVYAAKYMYEHLVEGSSLYLNGRRHASEKAHAHQMYGLLLGAEKNWSSSAEQLLLVCESTIESGSWSHQHFTFLRVTFNNLTPHLQSGNDGDGSTARTIEKKLEYLKNNISALKNGSEHSSVEQVERLLQSNLPWTPRATSQSAVSLQPPSLTLPVRSIAPSQGYPVSNSTVSRIAAVSLRMGASKKSTGSGFISSNMSGDGSNEKGETWPSSEFDDYAGIEDFCGGMS